MNDTEPFSISSVEEAQQFEKLIHLYKSQVIGLAITDGSGTDILLSSLYQLCQTHCYFDNRLFYAFIDLQITFLFMYKDSMQAGGTWNSRFTPDHPQADSVLQDIQVFSGKLDILYSLNAFAFRCRAFWDKYLGILFLLYDKENYDKYSKSKSRRNNFRTLATKWCGISPRLEECLGKNIGDLIFQAAKLAGSPIPRNELPENVPFPDPFVDCLLDLIADLDVIRTAEAHGTGILRKWSLAMLPLDKARDLALMNHWNVANEFMNTLEALVATIASDGRRKNLF
ncbi:MAG: hypothetical protein OXG24_13010 [Gammaproteobacteria bacterium]|nr:hypothetical protein [Gammaproteobacteria bacterium]